MADKPLLKMMYGIVFKVDENPAEKRRSQWKYTCCGEDCGGPTIHYKFKVKNHVELKHPREWEQYAEGLVPDEVWLEEEPLEAPAAVGAPEVDFDIAIQVPLKNPCFGKDPSPSPSIGDIAMQVLIRFSDCKYPDSLQNLNWDLLLQLPASKNQHGAWLFADHSQFNELPLTPLL